MDVLSRFRLDGRHALVTGGSKGLGAMMALAFAQAGARVTVCSRNGPQAEQEAELIAAATGARVVGRAVDVTSQGQVEAMAEAIGPVDILVNNAGINRRGEIAALSVEDWDAVIETNLRGPFLVARTFMPSMAERGWGRLIQMGSILSSIGIAGRAPYAASKAAIANMTRVLALEYAGTGVTANCLCPGPFATEMNLPLTQDPAKYSAFLAKIPMGRWGYLEEIAGPALFLASDASSFVTGATLYVDGGWTAQ